jgi:hypothetical protein
VSVGIHKTCMKEEIRRGDEIFRSAAGYTLYDHNSKA